jgi:hypothetical protein
MVANPHNFNADPDPDPAFHFKTDPDPTYHFNADPEPVPRQSDMNLRPLFSRPSTAPFGAS